MILAKLLAVPAFLAVLLTILASPLVIAIYRNRISFWMRVQAGPAEATPSLSGESATEAREAQLAIDWSFLEFDAAAARVDDSLVLEWRSIIKRVAVAYAAGGLAHALLLTGIFGVTHQDVVSIGALVAALIVFALPAVATVLYLLTASRTIWFFSIGGVLLTAYTVLGDLPGSLVLLIFVGQLLVPAALFFLFNLRFWRGVAPLLLVVLAFATFSWVFCAEILQALFGGEVIALWVGRVAGFLVGGWFGYWVLQGLRWLNDARKLSDQELFLDTWWLLYTVVQTVTYILTTHRPAFFAVMLLFPAYFLVKRACFLVLGVRDLRRRPLRLLLLRVFGYDARTERLFDHLDRQWRFAGRVELIAGPDLAVRNIGPLEFADFLAGRLQRRFLASLGDLHKRLAALDNLPYPDGRFRSEQFYCRDETWQAAMRSLAADCDIVLMDLRGFRLSNTGVRYELHHLARTAPEKPVVLLADEQTELATAGALIGARELPVDLGKHAAWQVVRVGKRWQPGGGKLMALLAGALNQRPTTDCREGGRS